MPEQDAPDLVPDGDPWALFDAWFAEARASEPNDPNAMALATADGEGAPSVRMVLLKGHDPKGLVFYTNTLSRKGQELAANPQAALLFHWKSLRRQVRFAGPLEQVSPAEADAYFATRPRDSQVGAHASQQSSPLPSRQAFLERFESIEARYEGSDVPRPPHWTGYRLSPQRIEFWHDMPNRLHQRREFRRAGDGSDWSSTLLYP